MWIELEGANTALDDSGAMVYTPRGKMIIQTENIGGYYDHTILMMGNKIRVMDTAEEITRKIMEARG